MTTYIGQHAYTVVEPKDEPEWGTHSIPRFAESKGQTFWTSGKALIGKDDGYRARRTEKSARREKNKAEKSEANRQRYSRQGK